MVKLGSMICLGHIAGIGKKKYIYCFVGENKGKERIGRPWGRWEYN